MKNIAIAGFGFMGGMHAQVYQQLRGAKLIAIMDSNCEVVETRLAKMGLNLPIYPDLESLLKKENVDVVDICLQTSLHASNVLMAVEAGKHVFCEKPLALSIKEGEEMVKAAEKAGVQLMLGHCIRFWPEYQAFVEFVHSGKAGKLLSLSLQRRSGRPMGSAGNWTNKPSHSGGAALDMHIHDTDFVHHLLGQPQAVASIGTKDSSGWSHIMTHYHFKDIAVSAEGGWNYPPKWGFHMGFHAVFENGSVEYDLRSTPTLTVTLGDQEKAPLPFRQPSLGESTLGDGNLSSMGGYFNELDYFIQQLEACKPVKIATGRQALASLRTTLAEIQSAEENKIITL